MHPRSRRPRLSRAVAIALPVERLDPLAAVAVVALALAGILSALLHAI